MIPIRDDNPTRTFPFVTVFLILANVAVFVYQWTLGQGAEAFIYRLGAIPWEITHFQELPQIPAEYRSGFPNMLTLLTSMFLHGGLFHLLGNMLYLWIFGDNVEAIMGRIRFFLFYILCGVAASLSHVLIAPASNVPMVGASGAISGVLGAYFLRFPRARVHVLIFLFIFIKTIRIPALFVLGFWFVLQVLNGMGSLGPSGENSVAWFAHIGGFLAGLVLVLLFEKRDRLRLYQSPRVRWFRGA